MLHVNQNDDSYYWLKAFKWKKNTIVPVQKKELYKSI